MFEYLEPDASKASNLPPSASSKPQPHPERVRHLLYGSLAGIEVGWALPTTLPSLPHIQPLPHKTRIPTSPIHLIHSLPHKPPKT